MQMPGVVGAPSAGSDESVVSCTVSRTPKSTHVLSIGVQLDRSREITDLSSSVLASIGDGYDTVALSITNTHFRTRLSKIFELVDVAPPRKVTLNLDDVAVWPNQAYSRYVIGLASRYLEIDSSDPYFREISLQVMIAELSYAHFCGITHVVVSGPQRRTATALYAQSIRRAMAAVPFVNILVHMPMAEISGPDGNVDRMSIWDVWNSIRTLCDYSTRLSIALQLPEKLPSQVVISRWFAEPVKLLFISSRIFVENSKGFPVLTKAHQFFLYKFFKLKMFMIVQNAHSKKKILPSLPSSASSNMSATSDQAFLLYLRHLHEVAPDPTAMEKFASGYYDYLQNPLQPLKDNLESLTYETFEKDPVKYSQYEMAIFKALITKSRSGVKPIVVVIAGAGRGPLVDCALRASSKADVSIFVYAVEKNPNAFVFLQQRLQKDWKSDVELVQTDMRLWNPDRAVDIIVSELLGSFGDNELSPECLDGIQHVLKDDGIMIPQSYSSHFIPAMSSKLYSTIKERTQKFASETPYVVLLQSFDLLGGEIHKAWQFSHPVRRDKKRISMYDTHGVQVLNQADSWNNHNERFSKGCFTVETRGVMHGFVGYFEAVLYGDVELSTRPDTINQKSRNMVSWFPIWFPISTPLYVPDNSEIEIEIWRVTDDHKVWYEWSVEAFTIAAPTTGQSLTSNDPSALRVRIGTTALHNAGGEHSSMLL
ncbi:PRMT5 arginine-N-methyltransferase-domain-containing protein [Limtongia smithiae]|uniref:PRMT5 arginine-N-methyltransferase-domain-containing protein n=1 Tax=Limtongia smithiae TaxID=1125753 RepID=UPI0034CED418